ncbi:hypothetical protein [Aliiglaciecola sp. M165]|uniref:hypothetical protein n=1 Tax=Aliiglaciecola sp. M165 TaxID=2593649 RepID=UPI00117FF921|nr:hypothetical protein [Aliiglaciecola sp. M165]TRY34071.1 hypothetical protein FM019_02090 [Aliiglaciecola sp. M165]
MIRLSKKAWNNVLIFSMILMILLFNTTNNILVGDGEENTPQRLLPEQSSLVTLQTPQVTIEQIGQGWRTNPPANISEAKLQEVVTRWQNLTMEAFDGTLPNSMPVVVIAWLAGENSGRVFQLYNNGAHTVVLHQQQQFIVRNITVDQLILSKEP